MLDSVDTILQSQGHEGKPHLHINRLDGEHGEHADKTKEAHDVELALRERLKELNCLYGISRLVESHGNSLDSILQGIVDLLPPSWQYPEICSARLILHGKEHSTANFQNTVWNQSAAIHINGTPAGTVDVHYLREMPNLDEGPFLKEERDLINAIAERTGRIVERIQIEHQLEVERDALQEANTAFRRVLAHIDEDKKEIHDSITANVDKILTPVLRALEGELPVHQKKYVALLQKHLDDLVSPFVNRLSSSFASLSPVELRICKMIRDGLVTKEIAQLRHVSPSTVTKQREQIRCKLHLQGTGTNLAGYLLAFGMKEGATVTR